MRGNALFVGFAAANVMASRAQRRGDMPAPASMFPAVLFYVLAVFAFFGATIAANGAQDAESTTVFWMAVFAIPAVYFHVRARSSRNSQGVATGLIGAAPFFPGAGLIGNQLEKKGVSRVWAALLPGVLTVVFVTYTLTGALAGLASIFALWLLVGYPIAGRRWAHAVDGDASSRAAVAETFALILHENAQTVMNGLQISGGTYHISNAPRSLQTASTDPAGVDQSLAIHYPELEMRVEGATVVFGPVSEETAQRRAALAQSGGRETGRMGAAPTVGEVPTVGPAPAGTGGVVQGGTPVLNDIEIDWEV